CMRALHWLGHAPTTLHRHGRVHARAPAGCRLDAEPATAGLDALTHLAQPESSRTGDPVGDGVLVEPEAVVAHADERHAPLLGAEYHLDVLGFGVLRDVVHTFLADPEHDGLRL